MSMGKFYAQGSRAGLIFSVKQNEVEKVEGKPKYGHRSLTFNKDMALEEEAQV